MILLNKPYRVLCQFRDPDGRSTLADFVEVPAVYPAGRLDFDSEGLLALTDDGKLQARISEPNNKILKHYWVQVEGVVDTQQIECLIRGVRLKDGCASAEQVRSINEPEKIWPRVPPIRVRKHIPTSWLDIELAEGRNRQIRRMTAAVGLPTLRLIRYKVGPWEIGDLAPGESVSVATDDAWRALKH